MTLPNFAPISLSSVDARDVRSGALGRAYLTQNAAGRWVLTSDAPGAAVFAPNAAGRLALFSPDPLTGVRLLRASASRVTY